MERNNFLPLWDLTPFTMQDFPERTSCIVWVAGCNMRCGYCHNPAIVRGNKGKLAEADVFGFLERRKGLLDGVVLSGGEATLYRGIIPFARRVKSMGFAVKLDTNGTRPAIVRHMLDENLLDFVALDYKAPEKKFKAVTACGEWDAFSQTLDLLISQKSMPFEMRTTVHRDMLNENDIKEIAQDLDIRGYTGTYYVQNYIEPPCGSLGKLASHAAPIDAASIRMTTPIPLELRNFSMGS